MSAQAERAERLRALHRGPDVLLLVNAWDAASARLVEAAGFPAVATSSAGVAFALGRPDGERVTREEMLAAVARIARAVRVPVTADMEAGYGAGPDAAAATAAGVIAAGAVGMNLEDWDARAGRLFDVAAQEERLRAARAAGARAGVPLVINARTDVFHAPEVPPEARLAEAVRRGNRYAAAGADCVFVPFLSDGATIGTLAREIAAPLNVLGGPGAPTVAELARLGVRRISTGSGPARAAYGRLRRAAQLIAEEGRFDALAADAVGYDEMQRLLGD